MTEKNLDLTTSLPQFIEDDFVLSLDRCFTDAVVKTATGFFVGVLSSTLIRRLRILPIYLGIGFGLGAAYGECEKKLKNLTDSRHMDNTSVFDG
ncbi:MICOS complex subunit MIC10-like [Haematobia irritans]|uniref:MICOS complex subunit MIC10-like n=1 Tax=Haematobia irritans TaxID=7368 RepID=UPI003F5052EA